MCVRNSPSKTCLDLRKARHPVIESQMKKGEVYVANDVHMSVDTQQVMVVTGPNMSGKSALLRMSALVVLMAQMGCYVPATEAKIGVIDSLFTRVGASDNVSQGESTFMVEMNETASILNNLGERSLILMDEVGRGTSTYDGISIAWAIVEHVHEKTKACMLFATHYHELSLMATGLSRVKNYHIKIKEHRQSIIFLYQLAGGVFSSQFWFACGEDIGSSCGHYYARRGGFVVVREDSQSSRASKAAQGAFNAHTNRFICKRKENISAFVGKYGV